MQQALLSQLQDNILKNAQLSIGLKSAKAKYCNKQLHVNMGSCDNLVMAACMLKLYMCYAVLHFFCHGKARSLTCAQVNCSVVNNPKLLV